MFPAKAQATKKNFQTGQSLIEIIATIAIGTVLILALVALSVRANRSSDFSKAQSQASKLASEGLEVINYLRTTNGAPNKITYSGAAGNCVGSGGIGTNWDVFFIQDIDDTAAGCDPVLRGRKGVVYQSTPGNWELLLTAPPTPPGNQVVENGRTFTRDVYVADTVGESTCNVNANDYDEIKQFTVVVGWDDASGHHEATTTSCIQR